MRWLSIVAALSLGACSTQTPEQKKSFEAAQTEIGKRYDISKADVFRLCPGVGGDVTGDPDCKWIDTGSFVVDGAAQNLVGDNYYHVILASGETGYVPAYEVQSIRATTETRAKIEKIEADQKAACRSKGEPQIGMKAEDVLKTCWGAPESINTTEIKGSTSAQLVYGDDQFVYITNGVVTAVQRRY